MLQCLGQQVESVYIKSQATYKVLERLAWRRYSIRFLDISNHVHSKQLQPIFDSSTLLPGFIRYFSHTLTALTISFHTCDISLPMLLDFLPSLTHLSVMFDGRTNLSDATLEQVDGRSRHKRPPIHNIIFLRLDGVLSFKYRIRPLLQRCSHIKYLILSPYSRFNNVSPTNIYTAYELCPLLRYIMWECSEPVIADRWISLSRSTSAYIK
ncbi:hypothetical protein BDB00DRAFT_325144 [Zychaea mexicana]|uniref:uncharacterized protein n=1 Tax=Zychaea mexicana TaxID=64656 RepID=UPI0022FF0291|nr:uncharacterized protein BDB00DRAFT_325144 [Zychaea mexicana]KAI9498899.1 hypothetical protein BDB00DRAFT_325144 [Zychaea mexicana]